MKGLDLRRLARFGLVGGTTVLVDAGVYALLTHLTGLGLDASKAVSFLVGAVFAYVANWRFTFGARRGRHSELAFVGVYLAALVINVVANALVIGVAGDGGPALVLAFLVATGLSAAWNFVGMSMFVFTARPTSDAPHQET